MKTPEIIFKGADPDMQTMKLSEFCQRVVRKNSNLESERVLTISAQYGLIDQGEFFNKRIASNQIEGYYLIKKGEFAYNKSYSADYPVGAVKALTNYEDGVLSTLYVIFEIVKKNLVNSNWLQHYFESNYWHREILERASEGARNHGLLNISAEDFLDIPIACPSSYEDQKRISRFLDEIDNYISSEEKKLENLRNTRNAYLVKLFPKEGGTEPEIRFKGFGARWLNKPLGELVSYKKELNNLAHCDQLLSLSYGKIIKKDITASKGLRPQSYKTYQIINPGTIVLRLTDLQNDHKSIRVGLSQNHGIVSPAYVCFNMKESLCANYCYYVLLLYDSIYKQFYKMGDGLRQTLSFNELKDLIIPVPSEIKEQNVIAEFFISMDEYIKSSEDKISKLKRIRKGLLERMFVDSNKD